MPTLDEFSERTIGGDIGRWRAAVRQAADLVGSGWRAQYSEEPEQEIQLRTAALLVYAIATEQNIDPAAVTLADIAGWFTAIRQRTYPHCFPEAALEEELRAAGHDVPHGVGWLPPTPADPVAASWSHLVNWTQLPTFDYHDSSIYPGPNLNLGLTKVEHQASSRG